MTGSLKASPSVIAAAVVAILAGLFVLLCCSLAFFGTLLNTFSANSSEVPPFVKNAILAILGFTMGLAIFGIATGIGLILVRNWARVSTLIWGGLSVFFAAIGIPITYLAPNAPDLPVGTMQVVRWSLVFFYGLPLVIGIWWLVLFNRKAIKAQFLGAATLLDPSLPEKPRCPLPIAVLAWFYLTSILNLLFLPFLPFGFPVLVFGQVLSKSAGLTVLTFSCLTFAAAGVGLLKLKPWSYSLTIGLQLFWLASTVGSALSPNYNSVMDFFMKEMQASLHLPEAQFSPANFAHHYGWTVVLGLLVTGAILGLLVYYRPRFLEAASRAASASR